MTTFRYSVLFALGFALCSGCGDSNSQPWENAKASSSGKSAPALIVPDNDAISDIGGADRVAGRGTPDPHAGMDPRAGMMMPGDTSAPAPKNDGTLDIGPLHWTVPKTWVRKAPGMVLADYAITKAEGDKLDARLTVSQFGGSVEANIDRWKNQFSKKLEKQNTETIDIGGVRATLVDLAGTFDDSRGPMAPAVMRPDYRMLAAVVEVPDQQGLTFIKFYGPKNTVAAHAEEVKSFIRSMKVDK